MLDTNTASYIIKGNVPSVRERLLRIPMAQICISTVTQAELLFGVAKKPEATRLKTVVHEFLLRVEILPWDCEAAQEYAEIRAYLERDGKPMGNMDMMIAAHALASKAVLVTNDQAFRHIERMCLEDWTKP